MTLSRSPLTGNYIIDRGEETTVLKRLVENAATEAGIGRSSSDYRLLLAIASDPSLQTRLQSKGATIAVVSDRIWGWRLAAAISGCFPAATVRVLSSGSPSLSRSTFTRTPVASIDDVYYAIASGTAPDIIVDDPRGRAYQRFGLFRRLFLSLQDGGMYVACRADCESADAAIADSSDSSATWASLLLESCPAPSPWSEVARNALAGVSPVGKHLIIRKRGSHLMKINGLLHKPAGESAVEDTIRRRCGNDAVIRIASVSARKWEIRADFATNNQSYADRYLKKEYRVRELVAKIYKNATLAPRQVITMGGLLLPESSMQPLVRPMLNRFTSDAGPDYAVDPRLNTPPDMLAGAYFHLDNEYPGHYGHFTSQDLTKLWAWECALEREPDCRVILSAPQGREDLHPYQYRLLETYGIGRERVTVFTKPVRVERLIVATFALQNPYFASPVCKEVWGRIRDQIVPQATQAALKRIFIGRSGGLRRRCLNSEELEAVFSRHGFEVIYPEKLDIADQIKLFSSAEVVAGYTGSGMFTMAYSQGNPTWIVIGSSSYTATTEYLFAGLYNDPIRYVMCDPEIQQPSNGWSSEAYFSDYTFNFQRDGAALEAMLEQL